MGLGAVVCILQNSAAPDSHISSRPLGWNVHLDPALDRLDGITRIGIEAQPGSWRVLMHQIDELFEQARMLRQSTQTCAEHNTVEGVLRQRLQDNAFGSRT